MRPPVAATLKPPSNWPMTRTTNEPRAAPPGRRRRLSRPPALDHAARPTIAQDAPRDGPAHSLDGPRASSPARRWAFPGGSRGRLHALPSRSPSCSTTPSRSSWSPPCRRPPRPLVSMPSSRRSAARPRRRLRPELLRPDLAGRPRIRAVCEITPILGSYSCLRIGDECP